MPKPKNYIPTKDLSLDEWLNLRKELGIGGSEAPAVLGYHPYKTPVDVWTDKTASTLIKTPDNEAMWIGRKIEPMLRERFEVETGLRVFEDNKIRLHPEHDCLFCNLDGMIINPEEGTGVFEAKAFLSYELDKYESVVPPYVYIQIQHNIGVSGFEYGYAMIWVKDRNEFIVQRINKNEQFIAEMNEQIVHFWNHNVKEYNVPAPVNEEDLRKLYTPGDAGKKIVATEEIEMQHRELLKTREDKKALENKEDMLRFQIESFMQDAEILVDQNDNTIVTWKTSDRFDSSKLKESEPDVYEEYCTSFDSKKFKKKHGAKYDKYKSPHSRRFTPKEN